MKKLVALILSFLLLLGCTGCAMEDIVLALDLAIAVLESTETEPSETTAPGDSDPALPRASTTLPRQRPFTWLAILA